MAGAQNNKAFLIGWNMSMRLLIQVSIIFAVLAPLAGCGPATEIRNGLSSDDARFRQAAVGKYRVADHATKAQITEEIETDLRWSTGSQIDRDLTALESIGEEGLPLLRNAQAKFEQSGDEIRAKRTQGIISAITGKVSAILPDATTSPDVELQKPIGDTVAVAEFVANGVSASSAAVAADWIRNQLVASNRCVLVEREQMRKVLTEHAFQQTGCTSEDCAIKLGRLLNARQIIVGSMGQMLDSYVVNARLVDVETGKVVYGDSVQGKTVDELKVAVGILGDHLSNAVLSPR